MTWWMTTLLVINGIWAGILILFMLGMFIVSVLDKKERVRECQHIQLELMHIVNEHHDLVHQCCGLHHLFEEMLEERLKELKK